MFITVAATTALVSVALNAAAVGIAGYAGYRYLRRRFKDMKTWLDSHDDAQAASDAHSQQPDDHGKRK
jgi:hypothetical protein